MQIRSVGADALGLRPVTVPSDRDMRLFTLGPHGAPKAVVE
jgi:hypothetical protein